LFERKIEKMDGKRKLRSGAVHERVNTPVKKLKPNATNTSSLSPCQNLGALFGAWMQQQGGGNTGPPAPVPVPTQNNGVNTPVPVPALVSNLAQSNPAPVAAPVSLPHFPVPVPALQNNAVNTPAPVPAPAIDVDEQEISGMRCCFEIFPLLFLSAAPIPLCTLFEMETSVADARGQPRQHVADAHCWWCVAV